MRALKVKRIILIFLVLLIVGLNRGYRYLENRSLERHQARVMEIFGQARLESYRRDFSLKSTTGEWGYFGPLYTTFQITAYTQASVDAFNTVLGRQPGDEGYYTLEMFEYNPLVAFDEFLGFSSLRADAFGTLAERNRWDMKRPPQAH